MNGHTGPLVYGGDSSGAGPVSDRPRADGYAESAWQGPMRTLAELREQASRLIDAQDPEASLTAAALYLQAGDRILAEAAQQFSEARQVADQAAIDHAKLAADRTRLAHDRYGVEQGHQELQVRTRELERAVDALSHRRASLEALEEKLIAQQGALEGREASLRARENEVVTQQKALEMEQARIRRRAIEAAPAPLFPDSGPLHLRPNPRMARTPGEFMQCLNTFKVWSGNSSLREISERSAGRISASTVRNILSSSDLPSRLDPVDAIVQGCGGGDEDRAAFASAWRRLYMGSTDNTVVDIAPQPRKFE